MIQILYHDIMWQLSPLSYIMYYNVLQSFRTYLDTIYKIIQVYNIISVYSILGYTWIPYTSIYNIISVIYQNTISGYYKPFVWEPSRLCLSPRGTVRAAVLGISSHCRAHHRAEAGRWEGKGFMGEAQWETGMMWKNTWKMIGKFWENVNIITS